MGTGLVLAAHGSREEPAANERVRAVAERIREEAWFDEVAATFHQGDPPFCQVLDRMTAELVFVIPFMMSAGYYAEEVLPTQLARNRRFSNVTLVQTPPLGAHPRVIDLLETRAMESLGAFEFDAGLTTLALVGHGTRKHPRSRDTTFAAAEAIRRRGIVGEVVCAFLDDDPPIEQLLAQVRTPCLMVEPFLISDARHAARDIPERLGMEPPTETDSLWVGRHRERRIAFREALGSDPRVVDVIVAMCRECECAVPSGIA